MVVRKHKTKPNVQRRLCSRIKTNINRKQPDNKHTTKENIQRNNQENKPNNQENKPNNQENKPHHPKKQTKYQKNNLQKELINNSTACTKINLLFIHK